MVAIRNNRVSALHGDTYKAAQSPDDSRLTVKNARGTELFYIRFLNPTTVQFRGYLGCDGAHTIYVKEGAPIAGVLGSICVAGAKTGFQIGSR